MQSDIFVHFGLPATRVAETNANATRASIRIIADFIVRFAVRVKLIGPK